MKLSISGKHATRAALTAAMLAAAGGANASLVLLGSIDMTGTGLGNVPTVLTLQSPGSSTSEQGSVAWNGTSNIVTGDTQAINTTRTLAEAGATAASNLRIVFNPNEPGNTGDNSITLNSLTMTIYSPNGASLFSANLAPAGSTETALNFSSTQVGTGRSGFVFGLDAAQQAAATQAGAFAGAFQNNRIGLASSLTNAQGAIDTFFVGNQGGNPGSGGLPPLVGPIPEPGTMAMLATGLLAMGGIARRRKSM
ncbi:MAG TPA: PEP-CTERM sorting domain-containing protein [Burkholderiales bacterium]|nr:PEP-CTERM sorting domain-containing protein [Burkholderiales bacterium]